MASHRHKGWRATGTAGSFGAAAAAARTLKLNAEATHHALAAAAAQASGNWAFQQSGGMELYLAAGTAARNGLVAALLAEAGFRGADDPLTAGDGGFFGMTSDAADPSQISEGLGTHFRLLDTCIKMYPTCHSSQTGIDAAINLRAKHKITLADIERISVRAGEITRLQCGWAYEPAAPAKLIFHMGYAMALAIRDGVVRPADFQGKSPRDPELTRIAKATEVTADPELTAIYAERKPCEVTIHLRDGCTLSERVDYCRGEPENPPEPATVIAKFRVNSGERLSANILDEIVERVLGLEYEKELGPLLRLLRL
jgi:2-methylcitrate dehydratase PrpD